MKENHLMSKTTIGERSYALMKMKAMPAYMIGKKIFTEMENTEDSQSIAMQLLGSPNEETIYALCEGISCDSKKIDFDTHFQKYPQDTIPVIMWSLKENVLPFFEQDALEALSKVMETE